MGGVRLSGRLEASSITHTQRHSFRESKPATFLETLRRLSEGSLFGTFIRQNTTRATSSSSCRSPQSYSCSYNRGGSLTLPVPLILPNTPKYFTSTAANINLSVGKCMMIVQKKDGWTQSCIPVIHTQWRTPFLITDLKSVYEPAVFCSTFCSFPDSWFMMTQTLFLRHTSERQLSPHILYIQKLKNLDQPQNTWSSNQKSEVLMLKPGQYFKTAEEEVPNSSYENNNNKINLTVITIMI